MFPWYLNCFYFGFYKTLFKTLSFIEANRTENNLHPNQQFSNKGIKQTINSQRIVLIGYWLVTGVYSTTNYEWLQQRKTGCTSWTETSRLYSQIEAVIFASFRQEKPWRQNRTSSPFFVIVSLSMRHYVQAGLLSHSTFINVVLHFSSWQCRRT